jgi:hypothetical protein
MGADGIIGMSKENLLIMGDLRTFSGFFYEEKIRALP